MYLQMNENIQRKYTRPERVEGRGAEKKNKQIESTTAVCLHVWNMENAGTNGDKK